MKIENLQAALADLNKEIGQHDCDRMCNHENEIRHALELAIAVKGAKAQGGWQDISTAPKDGTEILVPYTDWSGYISACWASYENDPSQENWFEGDLSDELGFDPKYWMPLPAAPNLLKGGSDE